MTIILFLYTVIWFKGLIIIIIISKQLCHYQTWPIKWNIVFSKQRSCRYCCMNALYGRLLNVWRKNLTATTQECVVLSSADSSTYMQNHNDAIDKQTQEDFFNKIYTSHFIGMFVCERELEIEQNCNILTPTLMAVSVVFFSFSRCSSGGPEAQLSARWWLSLLHLITNWSGPQTPLGYPRAPSAGCGFPYHISFITHLISNSIGSLRAPSAGRWFSLPHLVLVLSPTLWLLSWLSYIIVQRPLNRLLDLCNGMFDRHQAEITVMQFTRHSLPVHHSVVAQWNLHLVSYYQP